MKKFQNYWKDQCLVVDDNRSRFGTAVLPLGNGCYTKCSIPDYLVEWDGVAHGGMIALLVDEVSQWTMIGSHGKMGLTREITVR